MTADYSQYLVEGDNSRYASAGGLVVPVVTRAGREPDTTGQSAGATRISGVSIQHTPATRIWFGKVLNDPGYRSAPHHHGEAETGGYVLSGRAPDLLRDEKFEDYIELRGGRLGVRAPVHAARRMQSGPQPAADLDDHAHAGEHRGEPAGGRGHGPAGLDGAAVTHAPSSEIFTDAVTLKPAAPEHFDTAFTAVTQPVPWPKAYGGDLVAQAIVAAMRTVGDGKSLNSAHSYFMRPADIGAEVRYEVEHLRDGRGFSTRQVRAFQHGKALYTCLASFAAGESGQEFHPDFPADVPEPETLPSAADYLAERTGGTMTDVSRAYWSRGRGFDMRHVPGPVYLTVEGAKVAHPSRSGPPLRPASARRRARRGATRYRGIGIRVRLHHPRARTPGLRPVLGG